MNDSLRLYEENQKLVYYAVSMYFPCWLHDEDLIQVAKISLWRACEAFDPAKGTISTFATKYIRTGVYSYLRDCCKLPPSSVPFDEAYISDGSLDMASSNEDSGLSLELDKMIDGLKPQVRLIVALRSAGLTAKEVAEALDCSPQNVSQLLKRNRKKIEWCFKHKG